MLNLNQWGDGLQSLEDIIVIFCANNRVQETELKERLAGRKRGTASGVL